MIELAGDILEGGGQILRNAATLSCILKKPITIKKVRMKRSKPGLRPQHLCGFKLLGEMCRAQIKGDKVGSTEVTLSPTSKPISGTYEKNIGTAGSLVLLLQAALPVALFADGPTVINLVGGTNAEMAPPIDYFMMVFKQVTRRMGLDFQCELKKRGFYPKGGGSVSVLITPIGHIDPITMLDRGDILGIVGKSFVSGKLNIKMAQKMADRAKERIDAIGSGRPAIITPVYLSQSEAEATGSGLFVRAETSQCCLYGATGFGSKGKSPEAVADEASAELEKAIREGGCVDEYMQDQLIIFMALAKGRSQIRSGPLSLHTRTAIHVSETMTGAKFSCSKEEDGTVIISCDGIGFTNPYP